MAKEMDLLLRPLELESQADAMVASLLAQKLQAVGQHMLGNGRLVEVEENVFSTCQDPIEDFGERLMRARDTGVPLVEATLFPHTDQYAVIRRVFGIERGLVRKILRSDGLEHTNGFFRDARINYETVGLPTDRESNIGLTDSEIQAFRSTANFITVGQGAPCVGGASYAYEHSLGGGLLSADHSGINPILDRILEDFDIAIMRDGSIEGSVVDEIPEERAD